MGARDVFSLKLVGALLFISCVTVFTVSTQINKARCQYVVFESQFQVSMTTGGAIGPDQLEKQQLNKGNQTGSCMPNVCSFLGGA